MNASVVIPTLNAGPEFEETLESIRGQEWGGEIELIVVDSSSIDGTVERAERFGAKTKVIERAEFNHGGTRNVGVGMASGEIVALLTQDALPAGSGWLSALAAPFEDPRVAGAYARVVPRPNASPLVERSVQCDLVYSEERLYKTVDDLEEWHARHPFERRVYGHFNNVSSCVRRSVMDAIPFPMMPFGEDLSWGIAALEAGHAVVYEPSAVVIHSHASSLFGDMARHREDAQLMLSLFGFKNRPNLKNALAAFAGEVRKDFVHLGGKSWGERLRYGLYSPALRFMQILGQLRGSNGRR